MRLFSIRRPSLLTLDPDGTTAASPTGDELVLFAMRNDPVSSAALSRGKRMFDLVLAFVLLLIASPLLIAIAVAIRLSSPGPILFRQQRLGLHGRSFTLLKFRTMRHGAPEGLHERFVALWMSATLAGQGDGAYKLTDDPRITRVGRWLRKLSLDELPQLLNVLRGEMSLVGSRPPLAYEVRKYEPWQRERLAARPGLTGLWQVSGRNRLTHAQMCRMDISYIKGWNFRQDLKIILRTPWVMFVDRGGAE